MKTWRRSEPRDLRPFFGVRALEDALDAATIRLRPDDDPVADESVRLELESLDDADVALAPGLVADDLARVLGDRAASYALVVTLRDPTLKRRERWRTWPATGEMPAEIALPAETLRRFGHGREMEIALSLCLVEDREVETGWPSVTGAWIARKKFSLGIRDQRSAFDILPLTEEIRRANRLPDGALVFASLEGSLDRPLDEGGSFATCYLAEPIVAAMSSSRDGSALNAVVAAELVAAVATVIAEEGGLEDLEAVEAGSPLERFLKQLGDGETMSLDAFRELARDPQRMRATIHDRMGVVGALEKL